MSKKMSIILAAMLAGIAQSPSVFIGDERSRDPFDDSQREDERKFLATLNGVPKEIWSRRIRRGLTRSELEFIRGKMRKTD